MLTAKQSVFVDEYLVDLNATQAAIRAGYSAKTAASQGERLLRNAYLQTELTARINARQQRTEITQDYVLTTIRDTVERCRQAEPVMERGHDGEMVPTGEYRFDAANVLKGAELLGRHLGMWNDKLKLEHDLSRLSDAELEAEIARLKRACQ